MPLSCLSWNVQSITTKCDEVMEHVIDFDADLVFLCELWLKSNCNSVTAKVKDHNYLLLHSIRKNSTKSRGGGVGLLHSNRITVKKDKCINSRYESFEYGLYTLKLVNSVDKIVLVSFYRCQEVSLSIFFDELTSLLEQLVTVTSTFILAGDFNIHYERDYEPSRRLKSVLSSFNLIQNNGFPTNRFGHSIDLVISSASNLPVTNLKVHDMSLSDHYLVSFQIACAVQPAFYKEITFRNLKSVDSVQLSIDLSEALSSVDHSGNFCNTVTQYNESLSKVIDSHAPPVTKTIKIASNKPWFNEEYRSLRRLRRRAERVFRQTGLEVHHQHFVQLRKKCTMTSFQMKKHFYRSSIDLYANNSKLLYSFFNKLTDNGQQRCLPSSTDDKSLAQNFSKYYDEKVKKIRAGIEKERFSVPLLDYRFDSIPTINGPTNLSEHCLTEFLPTDAEELKKIIAKSGIKTSPEDPIPKSVLEENIDIFLPSWVEIINKSLSLGSFDGLKSAVVDPLVKDSDLDEETLKSYRPISNLQFLSKLTERVVLSRLNSHMKIIGCELSNQYGYKSAHNTESLIIKITNDMLIASDAKSATVLLLLDLSSAFDTIDKQKLMSILATEINIGGTALKWFEAYLYGRTQRVRIRNEYSDEIIIEFGVPQGSVLGPVLFNIYIRSVYRHVENLGFSIKGFADDHQIYATFTPEFQYNMLNGRLNNVMDNIFAWMNNFYLKLNRDKSQIIVFGSPDILSQITINGVFLKNDCIRFVDNVKNLGFYLDNYLSCDKQVNEVVKSCFMTIRNISSIKHFLGYDQKRMLVSSLVLSKLDYCNSMYIGTHSNNLRKLQSVQNSAARLIFGCQSNASISFMFNELHWLPLKNRILYKHCLYVHKCLYQEAPYDLMSSLHTADSFIRTAKLKSTYTPQSMYGNKAFSVCAPRAWNSMPYNLRVESNILKFKKLLKTWLYTDVSSTFYNNVLHP